MKKESITKDEMFGYSKDTLIEKYKMSLINEEEVRPIDNLIYWAIVLPPADHTYEIFKEYTKDETFLFYKGPIYMKRHRITYRTTKILKVRTLLRVLQFNMLKHTKRNSLKL